MTENHPIFTQILTQAAPAPVALYDANVLFPATLRDLLVELAAQNVVRAHWTNQIHDEWTRNVLKNRPDIAPTTLARTRRLMDFHVAGALIEGFEPRIETLQLPDKDDRHVLAAAIHCGAKFIVTFNLKDFLAPILAEHDIQAITPDEFLRELLASNPSGILAALQNQRKRMRNPSQSPSQFLETLSRQVLPRFTAALEARQDQL